MGLIVEVGEWVLRTSCQQMQAWQRAGKDKIRLAVNLSAKQFKQANLIDCVREVLRETGLEPQLLELEMTESLLMEHTEASIQTLGMLAGMGVKISIDDFGTGYSSLAYLKRFPIHALKIDRSFIVDLPRNANDIAITMAIIALANSLQFEVVAEGVETQEQKAILQQLGCQQMQGFLLSEALKPEDFERWLNQR
jgi:EAL domain-containing protein (putative c-di-GMP-specific phosphodiesterase class I)